MGASQSQAFRAMREAEAYPGPSVVIAYSTCINHGLRAGMSKAQEQMKNAVDAGFWQLYRYNPLLEEEGKNPFLLDSKEPDWSLFQGFLSSEVRFTSLKKSFPEQAAELFAESERNAKWRYESYQRLASLEFSDKE
jgi:pyruvate-ferredoxin/flavodoxin oxidoreductase